MADGLLLLHAYPLDSSMWLPQVEAFKDETKVVTPNFPGCGGTPARGQVTTMDSAADVAAEAVRAAGLGRVVVVGLSMGGYAAFAFWRRHRALVAGLVLANTRSGADDDAGKERRRAQAEKLRSEGSGFLLESPPPLLSGSAPALLWEQVKEIIKAQPAEAIAACALGMANRPDSTPDLAGIDVPTLVITSSGDTLIPPEATSPMASQVRGGRLETIAGAGHLSNLETPREFNRLLREHLARC